MKKLIALVLLFTPAASHAGRSFDVGFDTVTKQSTLGVPGMVHISSNSDSKATPQIKLDASSDSYVNGGNFGVGIPTPTFKLDVAGPMRVGTGTHKSTFTPSGNLQVPGEISALAITAAQTDPDLYSGFFASGTVISTGSFGIGTDTPTSILEIYGNGSLANVDVLSEWFEPTVAIHARGASIFLDNTGAGDGWLSFAVGDGGGGASISWDGTESLTLQKCNLLGACSTGLSIDSSNDINTTGTLTLSDSNSGVHFINLQNSNTGSGADSRIDSITASAAAGDPMLSATVSGVGRCYFGIDNDAGDKLAIGCGGNNPGDADHLTIDFDGGDVSIPAALTIGSGTVSGDFEVPFGSMSASAFFGDGSGLTGIPASGLVETDTMVVTGMPFGLDAGTGDKISLMNLYGGASAQLSINPNTGDASLTFGSAGSNAVDYSIVYDESTDRLIFVNSDGIGPAASANPGLVLTGTGDSEAVGIGTYIPSARFHVYSSQAGNANSRFENAGSGDGSHVALSFKTDSTDGDPYMFFQAGSVLYAIGMDNKHLSGDGFFKINLGSEVSSGTNLLTINQGGDMGIGTEAPATPLHVIGEARISDVGDNATGSVVCLLASNTLGTCTDAPDASGNCTCI